MEKKAAGRGGGAGGGAGAGRENIGDFFGGDAASADVEHGSHHVADHVVQEAAASNAVDEEVASFGLALFPG